jgi:hypothetical protein
MRSSGGEFERELEFADRDWITEALRALKRPFSEASFANLFLFRRVHRYVVGRGDWPHIAGRTYDDAICVTPLFSLERAGFAVCAHLLDGGRSLYPVMESELGLFPAETFEISWSEADSDYLYSVEAMAALEGRARRNKRAQALRFAEVWNPRLEAIDMSNLSDAIAVLDNWLGDISKPWAETDYQACREGLALWRELELSGLLVYAGDRSAGFVLASTLADGSIAVHFAKGGRMYDGIFPFMFRAFAERLNSQCAVLNFEQDLGNPGFRQAKRAFAPAGLLRKYRVRLRG